MKIAILHEMLIKLWWAEKVVESWMKTFPDADIFTLIYDEKKVGNIFPKQKINKQVFSLSSQRIYSIFKKQRLCLPFMSMSIESLDLSDYDIVLCSSSWFAHWAITKPDTKLITYYHSPSRYLWDWTNEYKRDLWLNKWIKKIILKPIINKIFFDLRKWDYIANNRVDIPLANSKNTQKRIKKYYKKDSQLIYPPVETKRFQKKLNTKNNYWNYYIIISALSEFKKIDIAIKWFNELKEKLIIVWKWDYENNLKSLIKKDNIIFVWAKYWDELVSIVQNSKWLIFPWEEDFWIVPVEVMAAWKPIFAYNWWWLKESVIWWLTWDFFDDKNWKDFVEKFKIFDKNNQNWIYDKQNCIKQAIKFDEENHKINIKKIIKQ